MVHWCFSPNSDNFKYIMRKIFKENFPAIYSQLLKWVTFYLPGWLISIWNLNQASKSPNALGDSSLPLVLFKKGEYLIASQLPMGIWATFHYFPIRYGPMVVRSIAYAKSNRWKYGPSREGQTVLNYLSRFLKGN